MTDTAAAPTYRHFLLVFALWALGVGFSMVAIGWWFWRPLFYLGFGAIVPGVIWLLLLPFVSRDPASPAMRRFYRMFLPAMGIYLLAIAVFCMVEDLSLAPWVTIVVALLPVAPVTWFVLMMWRLIRDSDELMQRIHMESLLVSSGVVGVLTFAGGMLKAVDAIQLGDGLFYVFPLMCLIYGVVNWRCMRKYGFKGIC